jgi:hypothetical protein
MRELLKWSQGSQLEKLRVLVTRLESRDRMRSWLQ